jgi:iron complex outermembrane recepter protein
MSVARPAATAAARRASGLTAVTALTLCLGIANADEKPGGNAATEQLQEVVVTAQFRKQDLQTTPVAITALSGAQLEEHSATSLASLNGLAPNLTVAAGTNTNGPSAQTFIRGIGQSDGHPGLEPGVGIYVDEVYHGLLLGSDLDLTDLDRVEVLRGPQGTLAGKNSIGGAIKLFSRKPTGNTDGYVDASYGDFNLVKIKAGGNFTLVPDTLYARLSGVSQQQDGYMKRLDYACVTGQNVSSTQVPVHGCQLGTEGGTDLHAVRVALRWLVSEGIENNFIATDSQDRSEVPALKLLSSNNTQGLIPGGNGSQFITGPRSYTTYATYNNLGFTDPQRYILAAAPGAGTHAALSLPLTDPTNYYALTDTLDWKLAEQYTLTVITGWLRYDGAYSIEVGDSPYAVQFLDDTWSDNQFTEEIRLNGTSLGRLDWTIGGYYYHELANFGGLKLLTPGAASETLFTGNDPITSSNKSVFAHDVWRATDRLSVITGIRYTKENKEYTFSRLDPYDQAVASYTPVGPLNGTTGTYSGSHVDYRAGVEYQWTDELMTYAEWSTGFRGGGVNPRPFIPQQEVPFGPESLHATEVGLKSDLLDHHLRLNVSGFFNQYDNILLTNNAPTVVNGVVLSANNATPVNVGTAHIEGAEAELVLRPVTALQIDGSVSYLHFKFTSINRSAATIPGVSLDTQDPYVPSRMATLGAQYTYSLPVGGSLAARVDAQYQSSFFTDLSNTTLGQVSGRTLVNARLTWRSPKEDWQATVGVTNLTDRFYYINKVNSTAPTNIVQGQPGAPREWLVSIRRNF